MKSAGFELRKWRTNDQKLQNRILQSEGISNDSTQDTSSIRNLTKRKKSRTIVCFLLVC